MNNIAVVEVNNLYKEIDGRLILNNINLNLSKGKIYGITGKNGSGKTMLFKAICGLIKPTSGEIKVFEKKIHNGELPEDTGIIIENPGFLPQYSAYKNLKILASIKNKAKNDDIYSALTLLGLDPKNKKAVKKFSLGMKQRLGIAQAIMENPMLLILDEPMNALDEDGVNTVRKLLLNLKDHSVTIILASHNKDDIETLCDYIYTMKDGKLFAELSH